MRKEEKRLEEPTELNSVQLAQQLDTESSGPETKTSVANDHDSHRNDGTASTEVTSAGSDAVPDPFDPAALRLSQDFPGSVGIQKVLTVVTVRKPNRQEFVRIRPGEEWRLETAVFEDQVNRETYLVDRRLWSDLADEIRPVCLFLTTNRQGDIFFWRANMPSEDGRSNAWNDSALAAARLAESDWVRVVANQSAGLYDTFRALGKFEEPRWPEMTLSEILKLAFQGRFIDTLDHPLVRKLRGIE